MARVPTWQGSDLLPTLAPQERERGSVAASVFGQAATLTDRLANWELQQQAEEAQRLGLRAGRIAGDTDPAAREREDTIAGRAFNAGVLETGARRLEINARNRLDELALRHPADPVALERDAAAYPCARTTCRHSMRCYRRMSVRPAASMRRTSSVGA